MTGWSVRDYEASDLEGLLRLDSQSPTTLEAPVFTLSDMVTCLGTHPATVGTTGGELIGTAVSRVDDDRAWVVRISIAPSWRGLGVGSELLAALEHRLLSRGVARISALLPHGETGSAAFANSGFGECGGVSYYEKVESNSPKSAQLLTELGAVVPHARLWAQIAGMNAEKDMIERKLVLPLARPEQATEHGVEPPHAVILFGPPGTGKTTFARAWPVDSGGPSSRSSPPDSLPGPVLPLESTLSSAR